MGRRMQPIVGFRIPHSWYRQLAGQASGWTYSLPWLTFAARRYAPFAPRFAPGRISSKVVVDNVLESVLFTIAVVDQRRRGAAVDWTERPHDAGSGIGCAIRQEAEAYTFAHAPRPDGLALRCPLRAIVDDGAVIPQRGLCQRGTNGAVRGICEREGR